MSVHKLGSVRSRQRTSKDVEDILKKRPVSSLLSDGYLGLRVSQHVEHVIKNKYNEYMRPLVENHIGKYVQDIIKKHAQGTLLLQLTSQTKDEYGFFIFPNERNSYTVPKSGLMKSLEITKNVEPFVNHRRIDLSDFCQVEEGNILQFRDRKLENKRFYAELLLEFKTQ